ncbi:hypothetical protein [Rhizobium sp. 21-4511-3d]
MSTEITTTEDETPSGGSGGDVVVSTDRASEIRQIMATDRDRYFREGLDQELAELKVKQAAAANPEAAASMPVSALAPARSRALLERSAEGRELVAAWRQAPGGFDVAVERVQKAAISIVSAVGDHRAQKAFMTRFDRTLTERARYHVYDALGAGAPVHVSPASPADLQRFSSTAPGAEMAKEWGTAAATNVARVWKRVERLRAALDSEEDFDSFLDWYNALKPDAMKAVLRSIAR